MRAGVPLNDEDRQPWLEILNGLLRGWYQSGEGGVLACSALKERYRQTLANGIPPNALTFVWLDGDKELLDDLQTSRDHGLQQVDDLVEEWSDRIGAPPETVRFYLTNNIHYILDEACIAGMEVFYRYAAECGALPPAPRLAFL